MRLYRPRHSKGTGVQDISALEGMLMAYAQSKRVWKRSVFFAALLLLLLASPAVPAGKDESRQLGGDSALPISLDDFRRMAAIIPGEASGARLLG